MSTGEVAQLIDVSVRRADQPSRQRDFPEPAYVLTAGRIWTLAAAQEWARATGRLPDREQGPLDASEPTGRRGAHQAKPK